MATKIDTKTSRDRLKARREPYWFPVTSDLRVGYRKSGAGEGTWIARRLENGKRKFQPLGQFFEPPSGTGSERAFDAVCKAARAWAAGTDAGVEVHGTTVEAACRAYVDRQRSEKGDDNANDAEGRFTRLVYDKPIGAVRLDKLTTARMRAWRDGQLPKKADLDEHPDGADEALRRAKDSANRNLATLKAALNLAVHDRLVTHDSGWKTVTKFVDVGRRRELLLNRYQRTALLDACTTHAPALRELVEGLMLTALRPGELAACTVDDFDKAHGTLNIRKSKTKARIIPLSTAAVKFFKGLTRHRIGAHPLVADQFGNAWNKDSWKVPFRVARKAAKLPASTVAYSLRHAAISELLVSGMDAHTVAKIAGTSTDMIDAHYGHLFIERTRAQLDAAKLG